MESSLVSTGYIAYGDSNQSDGIGPRVELGRFHELEEAIAATRGRGVQGDSGYVNVLEIHLEAGALEATTRERRLIDRRRTPDGAYLVGFLDLREYEFGVRLGKLGPIRPKTCGIFEPDFAVPEAENSNFSTVGIEELPGLLASDGTIVGAWRKRGDDQWRGEFGAEVLRANWALKWLPSAS